MVADQGPANLASQMLAPPATAIEISRGTRPGWYRPITKSAPAHNRAMCQRAKQPRIRLATLKPTIRDFMRNLVAWDAKTDPMPIDHRRSTPFESMSSGMTVQHFGFGFVAKHAIHRRFRGRMRGISRYDRRPGGHGRKAEKEKSALLGASVARNHESR